MTQSAWSDEAAWRRYQQQQAAETHYHTFDGQRGRIAQKLEQLTGLAWNVFQPARVTQDGSPDMAPENTHFTAFVPTPANGQTNIWGFDEETVEDVLTTLTIRGFALSNDVTGVDETALASLATAHHTRRAGAPLLHVTPAVSVDGTHGHQVFLDATDYRGGLNVLEQAVNALNNQQRGKLDSKYPGAGTGSGRGTPS